MEEYGKKQFKFKGKSIEELKKLDVREFAKLLDSRARRFILRNFQELETFINRSRKKNANNKPIKAHQRDLVIVPEMSGWKIAVHKGNEFEQFTITDEMIGHKLGEFALTRKKTVHTKVGTGATKGSKVETKR